MGKKKKKKKKKRLKLHCCERYLEERRPCKGCPMVAELIRKRIKKLLAKDPE